MTTDPSNPATLPNPDSTPSNTAHLDVHHFDQYPPSTPSYTLTPSTLTATNKCAYTVTKWSKTQNQWNLQPKCRTVGQPLFHPDSHIPLVFNGTVPPKLLKHFASNKAFIYFLEAWAAIITPVLIRRTTSHRHLHPTLWQRCCYPRHH